jgi:hypothetical protein
MHIQCVGTELREPVVLNLNKFDKKCEKGLRECHLSEIKVRRPRMSEI